MFTLLVGLSVSVCQQDTGTIKVADRFSGNLVGG